MVDGLKIIKGIVNENYRKLFWGSVKQILLTKKIVQLFASFKIVKIYSMFEFL